jgi:hypothetical protein
MKPVRGQHTPALVTVTAGVIAGSGPKPALDGAVNVLQSMGD